MDTSSVYPAATESSTFQPTSCPVTVPGFRPYAPCNPKAWKYSFLQGKVLVIEGTISAGKSTLCEYTARHLQDLGLSAVYIPEYVNQELLKYFLNDMEHYAYVFQLFMLEMRAMMYQKALEYAQMGYIVLLDRMLHGDLVFARFHYQKGNISSDQYQSYLQRMEEMNLPNPSLVLYLDVSPERALERARRRSRPGEFKYDLGYFQGIHDQYQEILQEYHSSVLNIPYHEDILVDGMNQRVREILDTCIRFLIQS